MEARISASRSQGVSTHKRQKPRTTGEGLNREINCIDHPQGHNKRQGFVHYTDRDIRFECTERSQPVMIDKMNITFGSVVERWTLEQEFGGSKPTSTMLCP